MPPIRWRQSLQKSSNFRTAAPVKYTATARLRPLLSQPSMLTSQAQAIARHLLQYDISHHIVLY